jgi:copper transport protein
MGHRRRFATALAFVSLLGAILLGAGAGPASAHADFISSNPPPYAIWNVVPGSVSITVSEAVQPGAETITVTNLTGAQVDDKATQISPTDPATFRVGLISGLGPSVYAVTWVAVSADDGHFTSGTFYFMVTYKDGRLPGQFPQTGPLVVHQPISPLDVALEAVGFVGFAAAFGGILLVGLLWAPLVSSLEPADRKNPAEGFRALLRFARWGAVAFTTAAAGLWVENLIRLPPADVGGLVDSTFLLARLLETAVGVVLIVLTSRLLVRVAPAEMLGELPWEFLPLIFAGFVYILLEVAASHTASEQAWWPLGPIADAVHLYGAALWVGGLLAILRARPWLRGPTPASFTRDLLAAFSRFAFLGALLVVTAGAILALVLVGTVNGLVGTTYGWIVLAKTSLVVPIVALGAWNRRTLRRDAGVEAPEPKALERLARNVRAEAILGGVILVLAGFLVTVNPASAPTPQNPNFLLETTSQDLHGILTVNPYPALPGGYYFQLELYYAANGTPFLGGGNGTLTLTPPGASGAGSTVPLDGPHDNHYFTPQAIPLDLPGTWGVAANVHGPTGAPVVLSYTLALHT